MINFMQDNILFILVVAYIIFMTLRGHKRGFFRIAISMLSIIITLFFSSIIFPAINNYIKENTSIENGISKLMLENIGVENISAINANDEISQAAAIDSLALPKNVKNALIKNNNSEIYALLGVDNFKEYISEYISETILNTIMFVIVFSVIWMILHILMEVLDIFSKIPVIHGLNQIAGAVIGFSNAIIILWILSLFVGAISGIPLGQSILAKIESNWFLSLIFNNNLISTYMKKILYEKF